MGISFYKIIRKYKMSKGFRFEISVIKNTTNYRLIQNPERVQLITENLEKDELWGWCEPVVKVHFDKFTAEASLANASFASEEDFKSSEEYISLKEEAIEELRRYLDFALRTLAKRTKEYYQSIGKENPYLDAGG